jgi:hypothetical protein
MSDQSRGGSGRARTGKLARCLLALIAVAVGLLVWVGLAGGAQPDESYEAAVSAAGPAAWFRFSDLAGSHTIEDAVGSHMYTAANSGIGLGGTGPFRGSGSGEFGGEAFAALASDPLLGATAFTVEGWVNWAGGSSFGQPIFDFGSGSSDYMYLTPASSASKHLMAFEIHTGVGTVIAQAKKELTAGAWEYVVVSETSTGTLTLYLNGEVDGTPVEKAAISPASLGSSVPDAYLGKSLSGSPTFDGSLSDVAFYTKALPPEQIKEHYVVAESPVNVEAPSISGEAKEAASLTGKHGSWTGLEPFTYAYQWQRCQGTSCANISKATSETYKLVSADVDSTLQVVVTASNTVKKEGVTATSSQSATVEGKPTNIALPVISGDAKVGQKLTVSEGGWRVFPPAAFGYLWESCVKTSCGSAEGPDKAVSYRITPKQLGDTLRAKVTASNTLGEGSATSAATAKVVAGPPVNVTPPTIRGEAREGQKLEANEGTWAGSEPIEYTNYVWQRCKEGICHPIEGASGAKDNTYTLTSNDVGDTIEVEVSAKNSVGKSSATSPQTGEVIPVPPSNTQAPAISGVDTDGQTLTASNGVWGGAPPLTYTYQWEECNSEGMGCIRIDDATSASYTLIHQDVGKTLRVVVSAENKGGSGSQPSRPTAVVEAQPPTNTQAPTISGQPRDGETVAASTGSWEGTPPLTYAYQWERCDAQDESCKEIAQATGTSYTIGHLDVGATLRVTVTASNAAGHSAASSQPTPIVQAQPPSNTQPPVIAGETREGGTLTASTGEWAGTPPLEYSYQWQDCNSLGEGCLPIAGATSASYQLSAADVGETLVVTVQAESVAGNAAASSAPSAVITAQCSDTWTGGAGDGLWRTAGNWSTGAVPTASDQACLPGEATAHIDGGSNRVGSITGEGDLAISGGSLELASGAQASSVGTLSLSAGTLTGPGTLDIGSSFVLRDDAVMAGSGSIVIEAGATGLIEAETGCEPMILTRRSLVNEGTLSYVWGTLLMSDGASLLNKGTLLYDTQSACFEPQIQIPSDSTSPPTILNDGRFERAAEGQGALGVAFDNEGSVEALGAKLEFSSGGVPEDVATGSWSVNNGGSIVLSAGTFQIAEDVDLTEVEVTGATVERAPVSATEGSLFPTPYASATVMISGHGTSSGLTSATVEVRAAGMSEWHTLCGPLTPGAGGVFSCPWNTSSGAYPDGSYQLRAQLSDSVAPSSSFTHTITALVDNTPPTGSVSATHSIGPTSSVSGAASDSGSGIASWQLQIAPAGSGEWSNACVASSPAEAGGYGCALELNPREYPEGEYLLRAVITDNAGNVYTTPEVSTTLTIEHLSGTLNAPPSLLTGDELLSGTAGEVPIGIASWGLQITPAGQENWETGCQANASSSGSSYECQLDSKNYQDGSYELRALITDNAGNTYTTPAVATTIVNTPPSNTQTPTITGTLQEGQTLSANAGTWRSLAPISYAYQWQRCDAAGGECTSIGEAVSTTYTLAEADVGKTIEVIVTASNLAGSSSVTSAASAVVGSGAPSNMTPPAISGTPEQGQTLTASAGSWSGMHPSFTYQWQRCDEAGQACVAIAGATSATYLLGQGDVGRTLRIRVTATTVARSVAAMSAASAVVSSDGALAPSNMAAPSISGALQAGETLSANVGSWSGTQPLSYSYQWQSCNEAGGECQDIEGATGGEYRPAAENVGFTLRVLVAATGPGGSAQAQSAVSAKVQAGAPSELGEPSITGSPTVAETLTAQAGEWGGSEVQIAYQWLRCDEAGGECHNIPGATQLEYAPAESDTSATLRVRVGASNAQGSVTAISPATNPVAPATALLNTWPASVLGTAQVGSTLTANAGSWTGVEAVSFSYQWQSCDRFGSGCENITGATAASYTVEPALADHALRVLVGASGQQTSASETSPPTQPVAGEGAPAVQTSPTIAGTGLVGYTLAAVAGGWTGEGPISYSYQWERCSEDDSSCSEIPGATESSYTLGQADAGSALRVLVSATNQHGEGQALSAPVIASALAAASVSVPHVSGAYEPGRPLQAEPGIWTGAGAIGFAYEWQRCNAQGEGCEAIAGATAPSYTPGEADSGHALRVLVTGSAAAGSASGTSPATPAIGSEATSPENTSAPSIEGAPSAGQELTATTGAWTGSEPISYTYQWQRCNAEGEGCAEVEGETASKYLLTQSDVGSRLRVLVEASNSVASSQAISEPSEVVGAAGPPANTAEPAIAGRDSEGQRLYAENGSWSGSLPLSYYYRWERCDSHGEGCTDIEGAAKPSYLLSAADVGSTVRLEVTTRNTLGSAGARSPLSAVVSPAGTPSTSPAVESIEQHDPSLLERSTTAQIEEQALTPEIADPGERLTAQGTLTSSMISKTSTGEFAVNTPDGEIGLIPSSTTDASELPTVVNGSAALYAESWRDSDAIVRPTALGETALLQLRSAEAPTSIAWNVNLDEHQRLETLPDGAIAVIEPPASSFNEQLGEEGPPEGEASHAPAQVEGEGVSATVAAEERASLVEGSGLSQIPAVPTLSTQQASTSEHELQPQDTEAGYERDTHAMEYAEAHSPSPPLLVIEPPTVLDAAGQPVPARLTIDEATVTLTLSPPANASYPLAAELPVTAPTDLVSTARDPVTYGLSDAKKQVFEPLNEGLKGRPLEIGAARNIVSWDTWQIKEKRIQLREWLDAVEADGLEPFITIEIGSTFEYPKQLTTYKDDVSQLMRSLIHGAPAVKQGEPGHEHIIEPAVPKPVIKWGAVNEPDNPARSSLANKPRAAADLWKIADSIAENPKNKCGLCRVAAGEFAEPTHQAYIEKYKDEILADPVYGNLRPRVWGLHDYSDLVHDLEHEQAHEVNPDLREGLRTIGLTSNAHVWLSEQGLELTNAENGNEALNLPYTVPGTKKVITKRQRQIAAARDFLQLWHSDPSAIDLVDYYLYLGPTHREHGERTKAFDSALTAGAGVTDDPNPREAYCVLVEDRPHGCGTPKSTTGHAASVTPNTAMLSGLVNPEELSTTYTFEYGTTPKLGDNTNVTELPNPEGEQAVTTSISGLEACTTYYYRLVAENEASEDKPTAGEERTFQTSCAPSIILEAHEGSTGVLVDPNGSLTTVEERWTTVPPREHQPVQTVNVGEGRKPVFVTNVREEEGDLINPGEGISGERIDDTLEFRATNAEGTTTASVPIIIKLGIPD